MIPLGDRAFRFTIPNTASRRAVFAALRAIPGVHDVVLTEEIGCVAHHGGVDPSAIERVLRAPESTDDETSSKEHAIAVAYDGPDLDAVAERIGLSREALIALHAEREYTVAMLGFLPGFAYLRGLDPKLVLPRRDTPRPRVPPNSVGIAAEYTGIYPFASPGGWHLLGRAIDFAPLKEHGATLAAGDRVRFVPTTKQPDEPAARGEWLAPPKGPHLEIASLRGVGLLVDGGRLGHMHEGVPEGGPLVASALARANTAVGNANGACAIELLGELRVVAHGSIRLAADDGNAIALADGQTHTIATSPNDRVRYLAIEGGIDAPVFLGGRGTLLVANIGRPLKRGDLLGTSEHAASTPLDPARLVDRTIDRIPISAGPDVDANALSLALTTASFRIAPTSDRTGTRLEGPKLAIATDPKRASRPMVLGAIELTPSGLIVLGPDHPTTGGYPLVGIVQAHALDSFFQRPPNARMSFRVAHTPPESA